MYPQKQQYAYAGYPPPQAYPGPYYHGSQYGPYNYWSNNQMRDLVAAHYINEPAPQAPARNASFSTRDIPSVCSHHTFNSHRKVQRPKLGDKKVYRPVRRHTLSRIDETPQNTLRERSKSLQHSMDFSSTRLILRSRSNVSADTSRSVPVCNQSQDISNRAERNSPQYDEPKGYDSASSYDRPVSRSDLPMMIPMEPYTGTYMPFPEVTYYQESDRCRVDHYKAKYKKRMKKLSSKHSNLYLAFMYWEWKARVRVGNYYKWTNRTNI